DLRVSTLPVAHGEKVVIRVLDARDTVRGMEALGLDDDAVAHIEALLEAREGMIIVTGPTGSGKTTTLYSIVRRVHQRGVNVVTVEDPVEYRLNGVVQVQVNEKTGLTFPAALRSILRQDPDVILVGEIRDRETAQIAVQAALTGHLVLSTLHTIDAASAVARLTDLGVDASKTATALKGIVAQRLLRRLCRECRAVAVGAAHAALRMTGDPARVFHAVGCAACSGTGYRGRIAITEVLIVGAEVERRIASNESAARILLAARDGGMRSLWEAAVRQVQSGNTSADELLRVLERPGIAELRHGTARVARTPRPPRANAFELVDARPAVVSLRAPVLVADASPESRTSARALLEGAGVTVFEAASASETLDMLDRVAPKLVVVDTALPGLDNAAIIRRVRSHATRAFVIVVGERADDDQEAAAIESGASDFIVKPFRPRAFIARLHAIIGDHGN
ncbi:MAG TPA: ATPase, T2SS/T4P/T4SS family, partial [Gemmatimonadaceae bacterium]|nr:ATPase, T2SS/T4P/T4SS family [Gemmatimonadaceae bacterium]